MSAFILYITHACAVYNRIHCIYIQSHHYSKEEYTPANMDRSLLPELPSMFESSLFLEYVKLMFLQ